MPPREVLHSQEFARIAKLPRRRLDLAEATALAAELTPQLTRPGSKAARQGLRPWQAMSLVEAAEVGGAVLGLPVGTGKTLIAELLPIALGTEGRTVLIMPASLREKTYAERLQLHADGWLLANPPPLILSREELQTQAAADRLAQINPLAIFIDEADEFSNAERSAPARIDRFLEHASKTEPRHVVVMTGSLSRSSILGYAHLISWALGDNAPVPQNPDELKTWAAALDLKDGFQTRRPKPGPLGPTLESARAWYAARLRETKGVILVDEDSAGDVPISIGFRFAKEDPTLDKHFEAFRKFALTPGGIDVTDPLTEWNLESQLGCGLEMYYDPPPPLPWRLARREFAKFVRWTIAHTRNTSRPLDTEAQVVKHRPDASAVQAWLAVKDSYDPSKHTRTRWLSTSAITSAADWLAAEDRPGIVMTKHVEYGEALAKATRLSYYGAQGKDQHGRGLHAANPHESLVASWNANKRGFNLQAWSRMLIVSPPGARYLEQIFGRVHRSGQSRAVDITILVTSGGTLDAFAAAVAEAHFVKETSSLTQKILRADIAAAKLPKETGTNAYRWASREA